MRSTFQTIPRSLIPQHPWSLPWSLPRPWCALCSLPDLVRSGTLPIGAEGTPGSCYFIVRSFFITATSCHFSSLGFLMLMNSKPPCSDTVPCMPPKTRASSVLGVSSRKPPPPECVGREWTRAQSWVPSQPPDSPFPRGGGRRLDMLDLAGECRDSTYLPTTASVQSSTLGSRQITTETKEGKWGHGLTSRADARK